MNSKDKISDRKFLSQIVARNQVDGYTDGEDKRYFHLVGSRVLRAIARAIGLGKDECEVRSNKGGIAVSGERDRKVGQTRQETNKSYNCCLPEGKTRQMIFDFIVKY